MRRLLFVFGWLALWASPSIADLPVHCINGHAMGVWELSTGYWNGTASGKHNDDDDYYCGYSVPDDPATHGVLNQQAEKSFVELSKLYVRLDPVQMIILKRHPETDKDNNLIRDHPKGIAIWNMVNDEGVAFEMPGRTYFAAFNYTRIDDKYVHSYCDSTMIGMWRQTALNDTAGSLEHHDSKRTFGCFRMKKLFDESGRHTRSDQPTNRVLINRPSPMLVEESWTVPDVIQWFKDPPHTTGSGRVTVEEMLKQPKPSKTLWINSKEDPQHEEIEKARKIFNDLTDGGKQTHTFVTGQHPLMLPKDYGLGEDFEKLLDMESFSWTNPDDVEMMLNKRVAIVPHPGPQGDCGSCYAWVFSEQLNIGRFILTSGEFAFKGRAARAPFQVCSPFVQKLRRGVR
eukprot:Selendium_serpulae@DN5465_c0_g1_i2.p1